MILVTGGREQGKSEFAASLILKENIRTVSGDVCGMEECMEADRILHAERLVRRILEQKGDPAAFAERLIRENPHAVITADEIGCGIVPADAFEREYRETAGRVCCRLAAAADQVYRMVCGIPICIKDEKKGKENP